MIKTPFKEGSTEYPRHTTAPGHVPELPDFPDMTGKSGYSEQGYSLSVKKRAKARISQPSDDVWYGNSWHDIGESDATTTRPAPGVRRKKRAR